MNKKDKKKIEKLDSRDEFMKEAQERFYHSLDGLSWEYDPMTFEPIQIWIENRL